MIQDIQATPLSSGNFNFVREFVAREAAIILDDGKEYLVETRLASMAIRNGCASVNDLVDQVRLGRNDTAALRSSIVDALTTNETLFFRDLNPFDALRDHVIPAFRKDKPGQPFTLWSAAASTGQEAYSISMLLSEHFPDLSSRILGTDISPTVIARAREGLYQQIEVNRGLPAKLLVKYFTRSSEGWQIKPEISRRVDFSVLNLLHSWTHLPRCHVVMLRNVMIYFDIPTRRRILEQVKNVLAPGGYLVLGGAETPVLVDSAYVPVPVGKATFYRLAS
jgi:chemotaxis protein methyltransferase CheR